MTRAHSEERTFTTQNYLLNRAPDFYVYLYNISESSFVVSRPPIFKEMTIVGIKDKRNLNENGSLKNEWILATKFPSPLIAPKASVDSSELDFYATDTRRFVMDLINPDNLGIDQDAYIDPKTVTSQGNNLGAKGVFYSLSYPPAPEEVAAAKKRLDKYYTQLLEQARAVEVSAPATLSSILGPEHHAAADHFGEQFSWHGKKIKAIVCDQCGERTKENAAFHKMEDGGLCIKDWDRAIKAGVRTKAQAYEATEDPKYLPKTPAPASTTEV